MVIVLLKDCLGLAGALKLHALASQHWTRQSELAHMSLKRGLKGARGENLVLNLWPTPQGVTVDGLRRHSISWGVPLALVAWNARNDMPWAARRVSGYGLGPKPRTSFETHIAGAPGGGRKDGEARRLVRCSTRFATLHWGMGFSV